MTYPKVSITSSSTMGNPAPANQVSGDHNELKGLFVLLYILLEGGEESEWYPWSNMRIARPYVVGRVKGANPESQTKKTKDCIGEERAGRFAE